ncbi:alpha/beta hydrolase-fold protein [Bdellovibrio sp. HCB2-146]|uniref:alpha/beta hydrolase-fold protein n=1 Tax=Bdellovibrio sp. HCB2-146 TaxID=3394362 RepID=UPI0039BCBC70
MINEFQWPALENFILKSVVIDSPSLQDNPWKDSPVRHNPLLVPRIHLDRPQERLPLVVVLSGFGGNGPKYLADKGFEKNFVQQLDECVSDRKGPEAFYLFVDAWTFWGGSQFINSKGMGRYEDYLMKELMPTVLTNLPIDHSRVCVTGVSSGGYGALHLASSYPEVFPYVAAMAPDSFFETCYLNDVYQSIPFIVKCKDLKGLMSQHKQGKIASRKDGFTILNSVCMALCYSPTSDHGFELPIDTETGEIRESVWRKWKEHDPVVFLKERKTAVKKWQKSYLEVGIRDNFNLFFGARHIRDILNKNSVALDYTEFDGTHFDFHERRPELWNWLANEWR